MTADSPASLPSRFYTGTIEAFKRKDVPFALAIIGILTVLLLPVPTFLLDLLLSLSLAFSVMILMTVLYIEKPLQFSSFPTVLLIAAMFRLSLNIASTRLILSEGHRGADAAGEIIEAFGGFVMAGSVVIGAIVFAILTIINFIVITKGSGRIAEVAARFSLDAMPGKQMAIDADLSAGIIDDTQAKDRREELQNESSFYGAMDGASKFVRGDAIAGLLITLINFIGGMVIGIVQRDLSFSEAAQSYTMLTIGDGLISQIPSLIVSTAAGMLISKTGAGGTANQVMAAQLTRTPEAMALVSAVLFFLAVFPSIPMAPFAFLSAGTGYLSYRLYRQNAAEAEGQTPKGGAGARPPGAASPQAPAGAAAPAGAGAEEGEGADGEKPVSEELRIDPILLELGYGLLPLVNYQGGTPLPKQIKTLRRRLAKEFGFVMPSVRIQDNMQLPHHTYVIRVKDIECARGESRPDKLLVMNPSGGAISVAGEETKEPAFGLPAKWINESAREDAQFRSYTVVDPPTVITTHLTETVKENVTELLTYSETQKLLDEAANDHQKLVEDTVPDKITVSGVQRVLQNLLAERLSIRDLPSILEAILEASSVTQNVGQITEYVRRRLSRQICGTFAAPSGTLETLTLSPVWEQLFTEHLEELPGGEKALAAPPGRLQEFVAAVKRSYAQHRGKGEHPVLISPPALRPHLRAVLERTLPALPVLSRSEIHPKAKLRTLGQI